MTKPKKKMFVWCDERKEPVQLSVEEFEKRFGIVYCERVLKNEDQIFQIDKNCVEEWRKWRECVKEDTKDKLFVKYVNEKVGNGLFALRDIQEGEFVSVYGGELKKTEEVKSNNNTNYEIQTFLEEFVIDGKKFRSLAGFINHSASISNADFCSFVCDQTPICVFFATQYIRKGEQILFDYSFGYNTQDFEEMEKNFVEF